MLSYSTYPLVNEMDSPGPDCRISDRSLRSIPSAAIRSVLCILIASCVLTTRQPANAQLPFITLKSVSQPFLNAGNSTDLTIGGSRIDEVTELHFSNPGLGATVHRDPPLPFDESDRPRFGSFSVTVSPEVPAGIHDVRAIGRFGISNPRSVMVSPHPVENVSPSHEVGTPTEIVAERLYHATASPAAKDHYRVHVTKGVPLTVRLICQSIDSRMIGYLAVSDMQGHVLQSVRGADHLDRTITLPADEEQDYILTVRDILYRGGGEYHYGLAVTSDPGTLPAPTSQLTASATSGNSPPAAQLPPSSEIRPLTVPSSVISSFTTDDDQDVFECVLQKGQPVHIDVDSHRRGQPTDVRLIVQQAVKTGEDNETWKQVAVSEDSHNISDRQIRLRTLDPSLVFSPPADGKYRVIVRDLDSGESLGKRQEYLLNIASAAPTVRLVAFVGYPHKDAKTDQPFGYQLLKSGTLSIRVLASRTHWAGPIRVRVDGLPPGVSCSDAFLAPNQSKAQLTLSATPDAVAALNDLNIIGVVDYGEGEVEVPASFVTYQWERDGHRAYVRSRTTPKLPLRVTDLDKSPISIPPDRVKEITCKKGETPKVNFQFLRDETAKQPVIFRVKDLPPGVTGKDVTVAADKDTLDFPLTVTDKAPPGRYTIWFEYESKVKFSPNPQALVRATEYRDRLQKMRDDPANADQHGALDQALKTANQQIETLKKQTAATDHTVYLASPTVTLTIQ